MVAPANALDRRDPSTVRPTPSRAAADELHFPSVADAADEDDSELYQNQTRRTLPCRAVGCRGRMRTSRRRRVSASAGSSSAMPNDCSHCCASAKISATEVNPAMSAAGPPLVRREHSERRGCCTKWISSGQTAQPSSTVEISLLRLHPVRLEAAQRSHDSDSTSPGEHGSRVRARCPDEMHQARANRVPFRAKPPMLRQTPEPQHKLRQGALVSMRARESMVSIGQ